MPGSANEQVEDPLGLRPAERYATLWLVKFDDGDIGALRLSLASYSLTVHFTASVKLWIHMDQISRVPLY